MVAVTLKLQHSRKGHSLYLSKSLGYLWLLKGTFIYDQLKHPSPKCNFICCSISLQTPLSIDAASSLMYSGRGEVSRYSVSNSQSSLIHSVQPSDCSYTGYVQGGVTMKMMDEVAGIVAFRHCKTNVVTASIGKIYQNWNVNFWAIHCTVSTLIFIRTCNFVAEAARSYFVAF